MTDLSTRETLTTIHTTVRSVGRLTPMVLEVTVERPEGLALASGDEFLYVMVSTEPSGIDPTYDMGRFMERAEGDPVRGAYYTVRRSRPDEIDLWVVDHGHPGSVSHWMRAAEPGDPLALWGPRRGFAVPASATNLLLVADESGLAAVAALIETADDDVDLVAVLETRGADHRPPMPVHPHLRCVWVDRGDDVPGTTNRLLDAVRREVHVAPDAAFGAAESRQISAVRRHLRTELSMPTTAMSMTGYWRR